MRMTKVVYIYIYIYICIHSHKLLCLSLYLRDRLYLNVTDLPKMYFHY